MEAKWIRIPAALLDMRPTAIRLYFYLVRLKEPRSQAEMIRETGLSRQEFRTALRNLSENELTNQLLTKSQPTEPADTEQDTIGQKPTSNQLLTNTKNSSPPKNPLSVELLPKEKENISKERKEKRFPSMVDGTEDVWKEWLKHRRSKKKMYSSLISEEAGYKKAMRQAGGNVETFNRIITQSIENDWQGTFTLREDGTETRRDHAATNDEVAMLIASTLASSGKV